MDGRILDGRPLRGVAGGLAPQTPQDIYKEKKASAREDGAMRALFLVVSRLHPQQRGLGPRLLGYLHPDVASLKEWPFGPWREDAP